MTPEHDSPIPSCSYWWRWQQNPEIHSTGGPERISDPNEADPDWTPRPVGFTAQIGGDS